MLNTVERGDLDCGGGGAAISAVSLSGKSLSKEADTNLWSYDGGGTAQCILHQ